MLVFNTATIVIRLGGFLPFGRLFKAGGDYFLAHFSGDICLGDFGATTCRNLVNFYSKHLVSSRTELIETEVLESSFLKQAGGNPVPPARLGESLWRMVRLG